MSLPAKPPTVTESYRSVREGDTGWGVYAVQTGLNAAMSYGLTADGAFGPMTRAAVIAYQKSVWPHDPSQHDGIVGPATKRAIAIRCSVRVDNERPGLPNKLIREMARAEGGDNIYAVNPYTPPGGTPGTDCGIMQWRCYEPFRTSDLMAAFDPYIAMVNAAKAFEARKAKFLTYGWTRNNRVRAERCALLAHNWPVGANDIAFEGKLYNPDGVAVWVPPGVFMLDGTEVNTRQEWVDHYSGISCGADLACTHQGLMPSRIQWGT